MQGAVKRSITASPQLDFWFLTLPIWLPALFLVSQSFLPQVFPLILVLFFNFFNIFDNFNNIDIKRSIIIFVILKFYIKDIFLKKNPKKFHDFLIYGIMDNSLMKIRYYKGFHK